MQPTADCLVTGATGFLGRSVVSALLRSGASVRCLVRRTTDAAQGSVLSGGEASRMEMVRGNLLSPTDTDSAVEGVRVVFHLAAESIGPPAMIFAGTVVGSKNLAQAILRHRPSRVVLASSLNVYGLASADPATPVSEDCAIEENPEKRDVYTHSKVWQERLFREYLNGGGVELTVVRPAFIYGANRSGLPARMGLCLGNVLLQVKPRTPLPITYVENCADAIVYCGETEGAAGETYNVIDDELPTGCEYFELVRDLTRKPRVIPSGFSEILALCYLNRLAYKWSAGQIPLVLTKYKAASSWRGHVFSSQKLKTLGWRQPIRTKDALERIFLKPTLWGKHMRLQLRNAA